MLTLSRKVDECKPLILGELNASKEAALKKFMLKLMNSAVSGAWEMWMDLHDMMRTIKAGAYTPPLLTST